MTSLPRELGRSENRMSLNSHSRRPSRTEKYEQVVTVARGLLERSPASVSVGASSSQDLVLRVSEDESAPVAEWEWRNAVDVLLKVVAAMTQQLASTDELAAELKIAQSNLALAETHTDFLEETLKRSGAARPIQTPRESSEETGPGAFFRLALRGKPESETAESEGAEKKSDELDRLKDSISMLTRQNNTLEALCDSLQKEKQDVMNDMEELSVELFEEANKMVSIERKAKAELEKKIEELTQQLKGSVRSDADASGITITRTDVDASESGAQKEDAIPETDPVEEVQRGYSGAEKSVTSHNAPTVYKPAPVLAPLDTTAADSANGTDDGLSPETRAKPIAKKWFQFGRETEEDKALLGAPEPAQSRSLSPTFFSKTLFGGSNASSTSLKSTSDAGSVTPTGESAQSDAEGAKEGAKGTGAAAEGGFAIDEASHGSAPLSASSSMQSLNSDHNTTLTGNDIVRDLQNHEKTPTSTEKTPANTEKPLGATDNSFFSSFKSLQRFNSVAAPPVARSTSGNSLVSIESGSEASGRKNSRDLGSAASADMFTSMSATDAPVSRNAERWKSKMASIPVRQHIVRAKSASVASSSRKASEESLLSRKTSGESFDHKIGDTPPAWRKASQGSAVHGRNTSNSSLTHSKSVAIHDRNVSQDSVASRQSSEASLSYMRRTSSPRRINEAAAVPREGPGLAQRSPSARLPNGKSYTVNASGATPSPRAGSAGTPSPKASSLATHRSLRENGSRGVHKIPTFNVSPEKQGASTVSRSKSDGASFSSATSADRSFNLNSLIQQMESYTEEQAAPAAKNANAKGNRNGLVLGAFASDTKSDVNPLSNLALSRSPPTVPSPTVSSDQPLKNINPLSNQATLTASLSNTSLNQSRSSPTAKDQPKNSLSPPGVVMPSRKASGPLSLNTHANGASPSITSQALNSPALSIASAFSFKSVDEDLENLMKDIQDLVDDE